MSEYLVETIRRLEAEIAMLRARHNAVALILEEKKICTADEYHENFRHCARVEADVKLKSHGLPGLFDDTEGEAPEEKPQ